MVVVVTLSTLVFKEIFTLSKVDNFNTNLSIKVCFPFLKFLTFVLPLIHVQDCIMDYKNAIFPIGTSTELILQMPICIHFINTSL